MIAPYPPVAPSTPGTLPPVPPDRRIPAPPPDTAQTGFDAGLWIGIGVSVLVIGLLLLAVVTISKRAGARAAR